VKPASTILSIEGEDGGEWVLVDLGDVVVHMMQPAVRSLLQPRRALGRHRLAGFPPRQRPGPQRLTACEAIVASGSGSRQETPPYKATVSIGRAKSSRTQVFHAL
jgi:hypothetical protein